MTKSKLQAHPNNSAIKLFWSDLYSYILDNVKKNKNIIRCISHTTTDKTDFMEMQYCKYSFTELDIKSPSYTNLMF